MLSAREAVKAFGEDRVCARRLHHQALDVQQREILLQHEPMACAPYPGQEIA